MRAPEGAEHQAEDRMFVGLAVLTESRLDGAYSFRLRAVVLLPEFSCHLVVVLCDLSRADFCRKFGMSCGAIQVAFLDEALVRETASRCLGFERG